MGKKGAYKNLLTLVSVLSVLLAFTLVCALCLFVLYKTGIAEFAFGLPGEIQGGVPAGTDFSLPVHTAASPAANAALTEASFDRMLAETPFVDSYYIKIQISSDETVCRYPGPMKSGVTAIAIRSIATTAEMKPSVS